MKKMLLVLAMMVMMLSSFAVCSASGMKEEDQWADWYWVYSDAQCSVYVDKNVGVRYDDGNVYVWVKTAYADGTESVSRMRYSVDENGRYKASLGSSVHYDENGALNILKKSSVVALDGLYGRGEVATPVRIRVA